MKNRWMKTVLLMTFALLLNILWTGHEDSVKASASPSVSLSKQHITEGIRFEAPASLKEKAIKFLLAHRLADMPQYIAPTLSFFPEIKYLQPYKEPLLSLSDKFNPIYKDTQFNDSPPFLKGINYYLYVFEQIII